MGYKNREIEVKLLVKNCNSLKKIDDFLMSLLNENIIQTLKLCGAGGGGYRVGDSPDRADDRRADCRCGGGGLAGFNGILS